MNKTLSADQHADAMSDYIADGTKRALALNNRSPIVFDDRGVLKKNILDAYWKYGFYILENVFGEEELSDLEKDISSILNLFIGIKF